MNFETREHEGYKQRLRKNIKKNLQQESKDNSKLREPVSKLVEETSDVLEDTVITLKVILHNEQVEEILKDFDE
ncbi:MAG: hypothetical protein ABEJ02_02455, partial [Candidatus Paceibacteria bacterium]